jgi:hypothetical protein
MFCHSFASASIISSGEYVEKVAPPGAKASSHLSEALS